MELSQPIKEKNKINLNIFNIFKSKKYTPFLIVFIIGFISLFIVFSINIKYVPVNLIPFNIVTILAYISISLLHIFSTKEFEKTLKNLEEEKLYNKSLNMLYDKVRCIKHDFHNIVQDIGNYISLDNMEGLKIYFNGLSDECTKIKNLSFLSPEYINNPAIYGLITVKYYEADKLGIKVNLDVFSDLNSLNIKPYELSRILGILLDNAILASSKCENKIINISFKIDKNRNRNLIIIENTYTNKDVDIDRIFEKGYTTKSSGDGDNHGLGLWEVRQILKKSKNLNLFTTKNHQFFTQQLEIYN